jgi:hypothetical protein
VQRYLLLRKFPFLNNLPFKEKVESCGICSKVSESLGLSCSRSALDKFKSELNRPPSLQEMIDNLITDKVDEDLGITEEMLVEYIRETSQQGDRA